MKSYKLTIKTLRGMTKNEIILFILTPLVEEIRLSHTYCHNNRIDLLYDILAQYGLDAGCYESESHTER